ncbi:MarR family transcriptional regulator [Sporolactobacillus shoreae]|uniref:MarR family transcriptional regulator n=2 Tax=Sporolactobacillus shoreae TaxID=1465501 RepID=A0A4Z0GLX6_9BACL|nr:MarR family transcriptional regulator [Sporolactobacillus shoreae]
MKTDNTIHLISRIHEKANIFLIGKLRGLGMNELAPSHGDILAALFKRNEVTMTEIATLIHRDRSTVTQLVRKLERKGYVFSKENASDRRSSFVCLTEKGKSLEPFFKQVTKDLYTRAYSGMTDEEISRFQQLVGKIYHNMD